MKNIRNFVIIAHIDHGKSTLADRFLEVTGTVPAHKMQAQYLDSNELERERGITIKMAPVRMRYAPRIPASSPRASAQVEEYILNLIDTPGHSDFSYEVSRALKAVEGAILLVDATQGIQAQTLANFNSAKRAGLKIIGAVNKIDLHPAGSDAVISDLAKLLEVDEADIYKVSGKTGEGVESLLQAVVDLIPPPKEANSRSALVFSSLYDNHKGVVAFVRVFGGVFKKEEQVMLAAGEYKFKIKEVGYFLPVLNSSDRISQGEIGYIATGIKDPNVIKIGDTIMPLSGGKALPGFQIPQPAVFVSIYPNESDDYDDLKAAIAKLQLKDSSLVFSPDFSQVLGRGFKCGFLGRLHFEITIQRLEREFNLSVVNSFPSVAYKIKTKEMNVPVGEDGYITIENPKDFPDDYIEVLEPITSVEILTPSRYLGSVMELRSIFKMDNLQTITRGADNIEIKADLPLSELILDFDDKLKSVSSGYASFSYEMKGFLPARVKRLDIVVAGEVVHGLSRVVYEDSLDSEGRKMTTKLKDILPKQQFAQAIQAVVGGRIIARETIPALQKRLGDFGKTGGDRTRKMKLWKKQKEGKARLKETGRVNISTEVFKELLKK
ncbi:MAG TPA: translation elongation factor 4 [Candidatus Paceibacterota bacterium]